jgi:hypothetical protein
MSIVVSPVREPLTMGSKTYHQITEDICTPSEKAPTRQWIIGFILSVTFLAIFVFCVGWHVFYGVGSWNLNRTIGWGYDITNFVWWVGIGHAIDLCYPLTIQTKMENWCKPRCRGNDNLCGNLRGYVPGNTCW